MNPNSDPAVSLEKQPRSSSPRSSSLGSEHPSSPTHLGYHLPAEWEPHEATWLSWPHNEKTWPGQLNEVYKFFAELVRAIAADEAVHINVNDGAMERLARDVFSTFHVVGHIQFHQFPTNDAWCRDHGATIVSNAESQSSYPTRIAVDWGFNGWGNQTPDFENDNSIANNMARAMQIPSVSGGMVLEGGAFDSNGAGTLLATETCLLDIHRNPTMTREQIEERLESMLGAKKVVWLAKGIVGDATKGHVDCLARFVDTHTVVVAVEKDPGDPNFAALQSNKARLENAKLPDGQRLKVETLPMPAPVQRGSVQLPASYASFYITNHSVIVPQFGQPSDQVACETIGRLFPGRRIVGINCIEAIHAFGGIHGLTLQIPLA